MKKNLLILLALFLIIPIVHANNLSLDIRHAINDLVEDNAKFAESKSEEHFKGFLDIQNPRVTMVMCSDSRVQTDNFSQGAENNIFVVRNIGNQFTTTQGSVEYGVNVLKTPVLIFVGHSHCGAVKAALGNMDQIDPGIRKELVTLDVKEAKNDKEGVLLNVNDQVQKSLDQFKDKVHSGKLAIVGAIYDFRNDYGYGKGQLIIVNLNGETNPEEIRKSEHFKGLEKVVIGLQTTTETGEKNHEL